MFWDKIREYLVENWKTTIAGLVFGLAGIAKTYGIVIDDSSLNWIIGHIVPIGVMFLGLFAKDKSE